MNVENLSFAPCPVSALPAKAAVIKVAVLMDDAIKITLSATAYEKLGKPNALKVDTASSGDDNFMQLSPSNDGTGWPLTVRAAPKGSKDGSPKRMSASAKVSTHPFKPPVTHAAQQVEARWSDDAVVIGLPDWNAMLERIESGAD